MKTILLITLLAICSFIYGQGVSINDNGSVPNPFSILDINSSIGLKGMLIPRMTWVNAPVGLGVTEDGMLIYCTDGDGTNPAGFYYWNGVNLTWNRVATNTSVGTVNYIPRWTPDGFTFGLSKIQDNGTTIGINSLPDANYQLSLFNNVISTFKASTNAMLSDNYAIVGEAIGAGTNNYGLFGNATGVATVNYGVYGLAIGGTTNWGGYFKGNVGIDNFGTASELRLFEDNGNGGNFIGFKSPLLASDITYTLPNADAAVGGMFLISDGFGTLSWGTVGPTLTGAGTTNFVTRWISPIMLGDGIIQDDGVTIGVNTIPNISYMLNLNGDIRSGLNVLSSGIGVNNYGIYTNSNGIGTTNYGIYSEATGATTNWAGYFNGNVYMTGNVGINQLLPKSILDIASTTSGLLIPRMTNATRTGLIVGIDQNSMLVYQTDGTSGYYYYDHITTTWRQLLDNKTGWMLTGNSNTNPINDYIGTSDLQNLSIRTNAIERIHVTSAGLVGVNVVPTLARLQVESGSASYDGADISNKSTSTIAAYSGVKGYVTNAAYTTATGYLGYHVSNNNTYGVYGTGGNYGGVFLNKLYIGSSGSSPSTTINTSDLEVQNVTAGSGNAGTIMLRQSTLNTVNGNVLGNVDFGDMYRAGAQARISVTRGAASTDVNDLPTDISFWNIPDASSTLTEQMRITNSGSVGISTNNPSTSSIMEIVSTTKGVLFPRMTTAQKTSITGVNGLVVFDTDLRTFSYYDNISSSWRGVSTQIFIFGNKSAQGISTTTHLPCGTNISGTSISGSYIVIPRPGVLKNMYVVANTNGLSIATTTITVMIGASVGAIANSVLTLTLAPGVNTGNNTTNTVSVNAGDVLVLEVVTSSGGVGSINDLRVSIEFY